MWIKIDSQIITEYESLSAGLMSAATTFSNCRYWIAFTIVMLLIMIDTDLEEEAAH